MHLSIYTAAFIAEVVRSGILAVDSGQSEAAHALSLSRKRTKIGRYPSGNARYYSTNQSIPQLNQKLIARLQLSAIQTWSLCLWEQHLIKQAKRLK